MWPYMTIYGHIYAHISTIYGHVYDHSRPIPCAKPKAWHKVYLIEALDLDLKIRAAPKPTPRNGIRRSGNPRQDNFCDSPVSPRIEKKS